MSEAWPTQLVAVSGDGEPAGIGDDDRRRLVNALAAAAGVDVVADAVGRSYRRRALGRHGLARYAVAREAAP